MCFFEALVQPLVIGELGFDPIVFSQNGLCGFRAIPKVVAGRLFKQFSGTGA